MKYMPLLAGGLLAGVLIVLGELLLNIPLLGPDWTALMSDLGLPQPTAIAAVQGLVKLLLLGGFGVWLGGRIRQTPGGFPAGLVAGLAVWFLVWAWVQWGMLLAGYVTSRIALFTVLWGLIEVPLAIWAGTLLRERLATRRIESAHPAH